MGIGDPKKPLNLSVFMLGLLRGESGKIRVEQKGERSQLGEKQGLRSPISLGVPALQS